MFERPDQKKGLKIQETIPWPKIQIQQKIGSLK
jgi:hypothetical protein